MVVFQSDLSLPTVSMLQDRVDNIINKVRILIILCDGADKGEPAPWCVMLGPCIQSRPTSCVGFRPPVC